ncbi:hypothetical protein SEPCBS57363_005945 [Sporothrix epigloea]|uniref:Uncharacterized protein n=1 Tax=Sporothrix epigloea TaxID=1892477 RepID=A0ABP0E4I5_9PEZI
MASLPHEFPDLAIHLTDNTRTPIVSSVSGYGDESPQHSEGSSDIQAATPTSTSAPPKPTRQQRAAALDDLAATALRARDAAARLGLGADLPRVSADAGNGPERSSAALLAALGMTPPEHVVVTYSTGAVLIESFLNPRQQQRRHQRQEQQYRQLQFAQQSQFISSSQAGLAGNNSNNIPENEEYEATGGAPLLLGLVAAPDAHSLSDARRATARLNRVGRAVQQELALQERRQ